MRVLSACECVCVCVCLYECVCVCVFTETYSWICCPSNQESHWEGKLISLIFHDSIDLMSSSSQFLLELTLFTNSRPPLFSEMQRNDDEKVTLKNILPLRIFSSPPLIPSPSTLLSWTKRIFNEAPFFFLAVL